MADVLGAIPRHGLEAVLVAVELAMESGRPSGEHVMNVLARLRSGTPVATRIETVLKVAEEPKANVDRYDQLRQAVSHVD